MIAISVVLSGCLPSVESSADMGTAVNMIPELQDCRTYRVNDGMQAMYIVRCPNSTTSTLVPGKNPLRAVIIDETPVTEPACMAHSWREVHKLCIAEITKIKE